MKSVVLVGIIALVAFRSSVAASLPITKLDRARLLAAVDDVCRCTHLERRSDLKASEHHRDKNDDYFAVTVRMSADGAIADYDLVFGPDRRTVYSVWQKDYETQVRDGTGSDTLKSEPDRRFCLAVIERLDHCPWFWRHYGSAMIQKDGRRGFRITFLSSPREELDREKRKGYIVIDPYVNVSVTRKGTVYGITAGG